MNSITSKRELEKIKRADEIKKESSLAEISRMVSTSSPALIAAAIGAALGSLLVLKATTNERGQLKWIPIPEGNTAEIMQAIATIAEGKSSGQNWDEIGFVMIQQRAPDIKALATLLDRGFGKVAESVQINKNVTFSLADIGRKALAAKKDATGYALEASRDEAMRGEVIRDIVGEADMSPLQASPAVLSPEMKRLTPTTW